MVIKQFAFVLTFWVILINAVQGQSRYLDSLYSLIDTSQNNLTVANAHGQICWAIVDKDIEGSQAHLDSSRILFSKLDNAMGIARSHYRQALINRKKGEYSTALLNLDSYIAHVDTMPDRTEADQLEYYSKFHYGVIYEGQGNYEESLKTFFSMLEDDHVFTDAQDKSNVHNSIGIVFKYLENYEEAKKHYNLALEYVLDTPFKADLGNVYGNLSDIYMAEGNFELAKEFSFKSADVFNSIEHVYGVAHCYLDIGVVLIDQDSLESAESYINMAKEIFEQGEYKDRKLTYVNLGGIYLEQLQLKKAEFYYRKAINLDLKKSDDIKAQLGLVKLYKEKKEFESALFHYEKYLNLKESLTGVETIKDINRLQFQYETAQKDKEIIAQDLTIKEQENTIITKEAKSTRNLMLALITLVGLVFSFFYYRQRQTLKDREIETLTANQDLAKLESLIEGEENERKRLAQDLHDGINGDLSVIKYKVTAIDKRKLNQEEAEEYISAISMLDNAIEQVRSISHDLAPPSLQNYNLVEAISQYCLKISSGSNLKINFQSYGELVNLPDHVETAVYRITQELLNNSVKHAKASSALVQINFHENDLHVSVQDDGVGYDTENKESGLGLKNIRSRAQFLGAELIADSSDKGTLTTLDINFNTSVND